MKKFLLIFSTSFLLGLYVSHYIGDLYEDVLGKTHFSSPETPLDLSDFWSVYSVVEQEYFSENEIKKEKLVEGAIMGMVEALGDRNSEFMSPETYERFDEVLNGKFEGIGAVVEKVPGGIMIDRILKGSPAKKYGVRSGDLVIQVDDIELQDMDLYDAIELIKGPADTVVTLHIIRQNETQVLEVEVVRAEIEIPSVEEEYFEEENIAYIAINQYGESTSEEFIKILGEVQQSGVEGIILDVRDNGGGYLGSAVEILSEFIPKGDLIVSTKYRDSFFDKNYFSENTGDIIDMKTVVLINGNSASASEITAGALREYNKAVLVGEQSYGKGSVQQPFELQNGSLLKLTVAKWFTPLGVNIDVEGIEPDIEVNFTDEDYENQYDRQLEEAKKIIKLYQEKNTIGLTIEAYEALQKTETLENTQTVNENTSE